MIEINTKYFGKRILGLTKNNVCIYVFDVCMYEYVCINPA